VDSPKYIYKTTEGTFIKAELSKGVKILKRFTYIVVVLMIICSLLFQKNMFLEISFAGQACLIFVIIRLFIINQPKEMSTPVEIRFYDDYLIVYREHAPNASFYNLISYDQVSYSDIYNCIIERKSHEFQIYGYNMKSTVYMYKSDGTISDKPKEDKVYKEGSIIIRIPVSDDSDYNEKLEEDIEKIKSEIEKHSPLNVVVMDDWRGLSGSNINRSKYRTWL